MRMVSRRYAMQNGVPVVSPWGGSVMRYLDYFGRLVLDQVEHTEWPEVLVLDAMPLRQRIVKDDDPFSSEQAGSGAILVAVGYTDQVTHHRRKKRDDNDELVEVKPLIKRRPHVWKIAISGGYNRWAWADFLAELPGTPKWIVVDGEAPVRLGIKMRWGDGPDAPVIFSCEGHLQRKFRERALTQDKLAGIDVSRLWPELLEHNIYHFLNGYPPLTLTDAKTPSVRCKGLRLRDLPLIRREWDSANDLDPDTIGAGYDKKAVGWICFVDASHRWNRAVGERCSRLLGCPECGRYRGAASRQKPTDRERLRQIMAAWGDYHEPQAPIVTTATIGALALALDDEDF